MTSATRFPACAAEDTSNAKKKKTTRKTTMRLLKKHTIRACPPVISASGLSLQPRTRYRTAQVYVYELPHMLAVAASPPGWSTRLVDQLRP